MPMSMPMPLRWGPGPVFVHESIAATRRWQFFALRSLFVFGLLAGLAVGGLVFFGGVRTQGELTLKQLATLGEYFYYGIATVQITLVLLVAPVATADAICLDRARGNLTHMLATDLSSMEIVLGKLAARIVPVLGLVAATVPVLALAGLLGGVIIESIVTLTLITLVLAVLGCSLALAISVRATKTHEVLMAVYGIEGVWVLGPILGAILNATGVIPQVPQWSFVINPYLLAWSPFLRPSAAGLEPLVMIAGGALVLSAGLIVYAVLRIRASERNTSGVRGARSSRLARACRRLTAWRRQPALDDDPALWREWRRGRPSRLAKVVWGLFFVLAVAGTVRGIAAIADNYGKGCAFLGLINGFQATFGLLLVSLAAPTVLAEERVRGSLDVLLASPLSSERIVLAKWWGTYRAVPALALLPAIGAICIAVGDPALSRPLSAIDRVAIVVLPTALLLAQGAVVTSVGLALATWFRRVGRAVAVSVGGYAFVAFGWIAFLEMGLVDTVLIWLGLIPQTDGDLLSFFNGLLICICPLGPPLLMSETIPATTPESRVADYLGLVIMLLATVALALLVLALTLATFNRSVGRVPERPRRVPRPPRRVVKLVEEVEPLLGAGVQTA